MMTEESMFVPTAQGIDSDGVTLTLRGITPYRRSLLLDRGARVNGSDAEGAGHAVHRPVPAAALARLGLRSAQARPATNAATRVLKTTSRRGGTP
jgi:hypothetical protein